MKIVSDREGFSASGIVEGEFMEGSPTPAEGDESSCARTSLDEA